MDHLNIFNPYRNKLNKHEDELTRNFLILLKNIPLVQIFFTELIRNEITKENIGSILNGDLYIEEVHTQLSNTNSLFSSTVIEGRTIVSIIISDDRLESDFTVKNENRQARYDGVVLADPSWVFIIENKPSRENIWLGQLNPSISDEMDVRIIEQPCCLSWRDIISRLNTILERKMVTSLEEVLIENFIEYIDNEYPSLNPYTNFNLCKNNQYLLNKRCIAIMEKSLIWGKKQSVKYHKGWKHYIDSDQTTIKQIALDANVSNSDWAINLWLMAGDTMNASKEVYQKLDLEMLLGLRQEGFNVEKNFHISYRASNLLWFEGELTIEDYLAYWKSEFKHLKQVKKQDFEKLFEQLMADKLISNDDMELVKEKILNKNYDKLNICPGIKITYSWPSDKAIKLDEQKKFEQDFATKVEKVFATMGESF